MKNQQSFPPSLLYAVAPENFTALHLHDQNDFDKFDWDNESQFAGDSFIQIVFKFLKTTVAKR